MEVYFSPFAGFSDSLHPYADHATNPYGRCSTALPGHYPDGDEGGYHDRSGVYIGQPGYLSVEEIKEMVNAGWEVGSHSISHPDLRELDETRLRAEIVDSRHKLEELLGVPVLTFAYPFGYVSDSARRYAREAGYIAAMGASGYTANQWRSSLYYLQRISIHSDEHVNTFIRFLP